jgi:hypothetical protein
MALPVLALVNSVASHVVTELSFTDRSSAIQVTTWTQIHGRKTDAGRYRRVPDKHPVAERVPPVHKTQSRVECGRWEEDDGSGVRYLRERRHKNSSGSVVGDALQHRGGQGSGAARA